MDIGSNEYDEKLLLPLTYISGVPGKNIRSKLARAFNHWFNISEDILEDIEEIIQTLHNASLVLDDIEDNSILRRGVPVAHKIYGVPSSINAANYAIFLALEKCSKLNHPDATKVFIEQLLELHRGQGMEIYWRDNFKCPTEEEYCEMTKKKTGGLFMLAIRLMQLFSSNKRDVSKLTGILGLYFQIRDDYINLCSKDYHMNKSYCEDLTEGKFSFPIIHAIHKEQDILRQRTTDNEVKKYCVTILENCGSFEYTKKKLADLDGEAREEVKSLGDNPYMEAFLTNVFKTD
ncbi:PREDICTED: geranylgeranyl pyrophosphate synthase isoform X2 [Nicrophorus vespilloides]|uniref:Geranylgeranyl pyrophosphate synthase isoform X2 n=1 Tax=Nicrophorus vespilloides TaxID=110193 RepID=A0ABM1MV31_NICVS|nr:PREDICTED: geranylgeranyl pyrophosphate synthase isoform X2 [Nicrophorus vespilloides]